jgi:hypothetical protein
MDTQIDLDEKELKENKRIKSIIKEGSIKILPKKDGHKFGIFKIEGDNRFFTTWDERVALSLFDGMEVEFTYEESINGQYTNNIVKEWIEDQSKREDIPESTRELIAFSKQKIMEKELEKELNAVQKVQDSIPKSPVKYEKKEFDAITEAINKVKEENKVEHVKVEKDGLVTTQIDITNENLEVGQILVPNILIKQPGTYNLILAIKKG